MVALAPTKAFQIPGDWLTVALSRPADDCYHLFCAVDRTPEWLPILATAVVTERDPEGRAKRVAFQARLRRATIGYSCLYRYRDDERRVAWGSLTKTSIAVRGLAQFQPIGPRACLMTYALDVRVARGLPPFANAAFAAHSSSATMSQFRDFARRALP